MRTTTISAQCRCASIHPMLGYGPHHCHPIFRVVSATRWKSVCCFGSCSKPRFGAIVTIPAPDRNHSHNNTRKEIITKSISKIENSETGDSPRLAASSPCRSATTKGRRRVTTRKGNHDRTFRAISGQYSVYKTRITERIDENGHITEAHVKPWRRAGRVSDNKMQHVFFQDFPFLSFRSWMRTKTEPCTC